ncbi:MAG TPA: DUF1810 domain-containing protein [Chthoniobacteraceae bacterium]|jgi:uncharacterized protein (DUF1810 family)|nr:DUF1810 domain-containing protein [Chthoniobacteraceae bacterium]
MSDPFDLQRFIAAQDRHGTYAQALRELREGEKRSHWMWFIFPQIAGLGRSELAQRYAITGLAEAQAYLAHEVLGPRLIECARALAGLGGTDAEEVLGEIDAQKLHSSMTLFAKAAPNEAVFRDVLAKYFASEEDAGTIARL